jgi:hypothetical protein
MDAAGEEGGDGAERRAGEEGEAVKRVRYEVVGIDGIFRRSMLSFYRIFWLLHCSARLDKSRRLLVLS